MWDFLQLFMLLYGLFCTFWVFWAFYAVWLRIKFCSNLRTFLGNNFGTKLVGVKIVSFGMSGGGESGAGLGDQVQLTAACEDFRLHRNLTWPHQDWN